MIPRRIISIWLNDDPVIPEHIQRCFDSQKIEGYESVFITLKEAKSVYSSYLQECLYAKKWAKACDYLRIHFLHELGGIYLDADVMMEPGKNFDSLLHHQMFVGREKNNFVSNAVIGSVPEHPILHDYLYSVSQNFKGGGDMVFQPGVYLWTEKCTWKPVGEVTILPSQFFYPFDHQTGITEKTDDTICTHLFNKSWVV